MEKYTDQTFFYKQTPVNYDGIAKFTSIKGNTIVWNQLVQNGNFADTSWWSFTAGTLTVSNNIGTFKAIAQYQNVSKGWFSNAIPQGHKLLCVATLKSYTANNTRFIVRDIENGVTSNVDQITLSTTKQTYYIIHTRSSGTSGMQLLFQDNNSSGWGNIEISNVMLFDLTQIGLGSITSADEFTSLFPLPFYDYNQGTLIPFSGNGIKTVGFNQWDEEWEVGGYNTNGEKIADNNRIRNKNLVPLISGLTYYFKSPTVVGVRFYDKNKDFLGTSYNIANDNFLFTVPSNAGYLCFSVTNTTSYGNNICINISSSKNGTYEPYTSTTTDLPISTYFPTGMKRAGNVYDELTESKAITRIGAVEMSSLPWTMPTSGVFQAYKSDVHVQPKVLTPFFKYFTDNFTYGGAPNYEDGTGGVNPNNQNIYYKDTNYTSVDALKSAMQGFYLYYELATETETDAEDIFYKFYADGTEQLLPVNGSSPVTSYLTADIEYYDSTEGDSLYRRFWLINGDGERWDLTDKEFKSFLNNPTGLGFRKTIEITRYGEKANKNNEVYDFPQPSGELLFYDTYNSTRYDKYNKFIRFLMSQPITLYYMIPVSYISGIANIFTLDCDVTEVQKTESKTDHILTSSIVFNGLGFYEGDEISVNGTTDTYTLTNEGDFPVGFEITVEGSLTKPYITLSQDGELYGEAKFDSETAFNSLYLNSNDGEQNIILQQGGSVIPNPLSYQDLSISNGSIYVTFVKLAKGVSELSIGVESGTITNVNIKYSPKYRSV